MNPVVWNSPRLVARTVIKETAIKSPREIQIHLLSCAVDSWIQFISYLFVRESKIRHIQIVVRDSKNKTQTGFLASFFLQHTSGSLGRTDNPHCLGDSTTNISSTFPPFLFLYQVMTLPQSRITDSSRVYFCENIGFDYQAPLQIEICGVLYVHLLCEKL